MIRRNSIPPRLLILLTMFLTACQSAVQPTRPVTTRRATFTPLIVQSVTPVPTPTLSPELGLSAATPLPITPSALYTGTNLVKKPLHFILVQTGRCDWDSSWCPIEQGILDASHEMSVTITVLGLDSASDQPAQQAQKLAAMIDQAVAGHPDGIALTINDPLGLREAILRAIQSGIPIVAYHAGSGPIQDDLPYLTYLGMDNLQGGYQGGQRLVQAGAQAGVCIRTAPDQADLQTRCRGFLAAFKAAGLNADELVISADATQAGAEIQSYTSNQAQVNAFLTAKADSALAFYAWQKSSGRASGSGLSGSGLSGSGLSGSILHGTFDLTAEIKANLENGVTQFGIDAQPYLQGYQAVLWLTMIGRYGFKPASPVIPTGPYFVTQTNLHVQAAPDRPINLSFIQHALCTWDTYWCVVEHGIRQAAQERNVQVSILGPDRFDLDQMSALIDQAVDTHPDGMGVTVPDSSALHASILRAIQSGIPVMAYDSGDGPLKDDLPYLTFIGTNSDAEYQGGYLAALRLIKAGGKAGVCVNHQMGHAALDARCQGMMDAFAKEGLKAEEVDCTGNPEQAFAIIQDYAESHPQVNAYLTMGAGDPGAISIYRYLKASNRPPGELLHGTFDLSAAVVAAVEDGRTLFAVDGQPYLVGYIAVSYLALAVRQNIWPVAPITATGPGFVDQTNITIVKQLAGTYR